MALEGNPDKEKRICNRTSKGRRQSNKEERISEDISSRFEQHPNSCSFTLHDFTKKKQSSGNG